MANNPLSLTDPSGFSWISERWDDAKDAVKKVSKAVQKVIKAVTVAAAVQIAGCAVGACIVVSAMVSAIVAYGATGDWGAALKAGLTSAATSYVSMGVNAQIGKISDAVLNTVVHGVSGAAMTKLQGGSARSGFISGFMGAAASNMMSQEMGGKRYWRKWADKAGYETRTAISTISGAVSAKLSGGDAALGAVTAAMGHMFNAESDTLSAQKETQQQRVDRLEKAVYGDYPELEEIGISISIDNELDVTGRYLGGRNIAVNMNRQDEQIQATIFHELLHAEEALATVGGWKFGYKVHESFQHWRHGQHDPWTDKMDAEYTTYLRVNGAKKPDISGRPWK